MKFFALLSIVGHVAAIWPAPQSFTSGSSAVWLAEDFQVSYNQRDVGALVVNHLHYKTLSSFFFFFFREG